MAEKSDVVHLRVRSRLAPAMHDGQATEFGLQDRDRVLHPGASAGGGFVTFTINPHVVQNSKSGLPRFRGSYVHSGSKGTQHLYIGWRYLDPPSPEDPWVNRLKVHLHIAWDQILTTLAADAILETDCTSPQWGVLKNWHGLNAGRVWTTIR